MCDILLLLFYRRGNWDSGEVTLSLAPRSPFHSVSPVLSTCVVVCGGELRGKRFPFPHPALGLSIKLLSLGVGAAGGGSEQGFTLPLWVSHTQVGGAAGGGWGLETEPPSPTPRSALNPGPLLSPWTLPVLFLAGAPGPHTHQAWH